MILNSVNPGVVGVSVDLRGGFVLMAPKKQEKPIEKR